MALSQEALYRDIDLELSWSERDLPERERTKHVHRLHPYLGKFIPQLVEALLARYFRAGGRILDPFAGSGLTGGQSSGPVIGGSSSGLAMQRGRVDASREIRDALRRGS